MARKPIGMALEELENAEVDASGATDTGAVELVEATQDVTDTATEVSDNVAQVDDAEADIADVEKIEEILEKGAASGEGVSEEAAQIAQIAVEGLQRRLSIRATRMPALESFRSSSTRLAATKIALEGIGDTLSNAWDAVVKFFKMIWDKVKGFYKSLFDSNTRLMERAQKLKKRVNSMSSVNKEASDNEIKNANIYDAFVNESGVFNKDNAVTYVVNSIVCVDHIGTIVSGFTTVDPTKKLTSSQKSDATEVYIKLANAPAIGKSAAWAVKPIEDMHLGSKVLYISETMIGSKLVYVAMSDNKEDRYGNNKPEKGGIAHTVTGSGVFAPDYKDDNDDKEVPILDKGMMNKICISVEDLGKALVNTKKVLNDIDKMTKTVERAGKAGINKAPDAAAKAQARDDAGLIMTLGKITQVISTQVPSLALRTGVTALNYVDVSLAKYRKAD